MLQITINIIDCSNYITCTIIIIIIIIDYYYIIMTVLMHLSMVCPRMGGPGNPRELDFVKRT